MFPACDPGGVWPLNTQYGASDETENGNDGVARGTQLAPGPYGDPGGAFLFSGTANSYIDIPNNGKLDVRYSYTILAHIYPTGQAGPIFNYVGNNNQTYERYGYFSQYAHANVLQQNAWNYVGGTYNSATGVAILWYNGSEVAQVQVGVPSVATQYPVRVAVRAGDSQYFAGRIACIQLYNYAMTQEQILAARDRCSQRGVNVALRKSAYQTSTYWFGAASLAVDGNTNTTFMNRSCTHTMVGTIYNDPGWWVDLGQSYVVGSAAGPRGLGLASFAVLLGVGVIFSVSDASNMPPRGTICCRGTFATERRFPRSNKTASNRRLERTLERGNLLSVAKVPRQQIVPRGGILLASLTEKITPTPNKTAKEASLGRGP
ncbi:hypothetical protein Bbelb_428130 [Branchiostoma belcheri]|nr:hypothetical protein Bbelb_428130 [Branchiostoma belcheri]